MANSRSRFTVSPSERRFRRLTEVQRTKESRPFHAFLIEKGFLDATLSKKNCFAYFRLFCVEKNIRVGYRHMGWSQVMFILRKLGVCERGGEKNDMFTIREWSEIHSRTPKVALSQYMTSRRANSSNESSASAEAPEHQRIGCVLAQMREHRTALIQNKNGVTIKSKSDRKDGKISLGKSYVGDPVVVIPVRIGVSRDGRAQKFVNCDALASVREFTLTDVKLVCGGLGSESIRPGGEYQIEIRFRPLCLGNPRMTIAFEFEDEKSGITYHIIRFLLAHVTDADAELLKPTAPYERPRVKAKIKASQVIGGIPPPRSSYNELTFQRRLDRYSIPSSLRYCVNKGNIVGDYKERVEAELADANFGEKFRALLHVEELQMEVDIRHYDIENAKLIPSANLKYLILKVPGLAENRPSLLKGDRLYASAAGSTIEYEGFVHQVHQEEVLLCFASSFHRSFIRGQLYNVRFTFNRLPLQLQHRAVEILLEDKVACQQLVFPTQRTIAKKVPLHRIEKLQLFDEEKVGVNPEQYLAVQHILAGSSRPAPYLIFGPPGTGKTVTTVEAIKQVWKNIPKSRILACTPSNSAADDLACRLLSHIPYKEVLRLNAYSRCPESIDPLVYEKIMKISKYDNDLNNFWFPPLEDLEKYRIIVVTLVTAGRLVSASFSPNHFTHVFIDESGHAVEPECIIPVAGLLNVNNPRGGQLVLAGDPKQLGPILRSPISIEHGLQLSLLERLMERCEVYQEPFDPRIATKLVQNYRSHPDILALPNRLFYDGDLKAMANELARSSLCKWGRLPKEGFPIIFHGIEGEDEREERSPSFFNRAEASQVAKYVEMLRDTRGIHIMSGEIGVISPYRKQVQKIRTLLHGKHIASVKVGSVEEFQGSERRIIIISTVRSSKDFLEMDEKYSLGFLKNPKRFNVAITRAKALLIIIGNPYLLSMDEYWNELLEYCRSNGGYTGCHYMPRSLRDDDLLHRIQDLHLDRDHVYTAAEDLASAETGGVSLLTEQEDPEWREGE